MGEEAGAAHSSYLDSPSFLPPAVQEALFSLTLSWPQSLTPHAGKNAEWRWEAQGLGKGMSTGLGA